jgi:tetratricopeptide (TPR) repeat protein
MFRKGLSLLAVVLTLSFALSAFSFASDAQEFFREGYMASMSREWDKAIELYSKSIQLSPDNAEAYLQRAAAFEMVERLDDAIADYEKTLRLKPDYYLAMEYLAKLYEAKGQYGKAVDLYSRALPLVTDSKWKSMVQWWRSQAEKKLKQNRVDGDQHPSGRFPKGRVSNSGHR